MRVVAFNGGSRKNGNTAILLSHILVELEAGSIETKLVQLAGKRFAGCTACLKCAETLDDRCSGLATMTDLGRAMAWALKKLSA